MDPVGPDPDSDPDPQHCLSHIFIPFLTWSRPLLSEHTSPPLCNDWHSPPSAVLKQDITPPPPPLPNTHTLLYNTVLYNYTALFHMRSHAYVTEHMHTAHIQLLKLHSRVMNILHRSASFSWVLIRMVCLIQIRSRYFWSSSDSNYFTLVGSFYIKSSSSLAGSFSAGVVDTSGAPWLANISEFSNNSK